MTNFMSTAVDCIAASHPDAKVPTLASETAAAWASATGIRLSQTLRYSMFDVAIFVSALPTYVRASVT